MNQASGSPKPPPQPTAANRAADAPLCPQLTGAPPRTSIGSRSANKPPTARDAPARVSSAGVVQPDAGRGGQNKRGTAFGEIGGYRMRRASGEEFIKALVWRERETHTHTRARTAGEFLMSEDLTGDTEAETGGQEKMGGGGGQDRQRGDAERKLVSCQDLTS